jgi:tetratricopeptide (TPR) repeat protein
VAHGRRRRPAIDRIEIERNIIEQFLMQSKTFIRNNRKLVIKILLGIFAVVIAIVVSLFVVDGIENRDQKRFDLIMREYVTYSSAGDRDGMNKVVLDLEDFIQNSYFGFTHRMGYYVLGNIYFAQKEYKKAEPLLRAYAEKDTSTIFAPIALLKAAIACEETTDLKGAIGIYRTLEDDYAGSVIADQIYFNYARVLAEKNDIVNARRYYTKVISSFPESSFAGLARARLFMLGSYKQTFLK